MEGGRTMAFRASVAKLAAGGRKDVHPALVKQWGKYMPAEGQVSWAALLLGVAGGDDLEVEKRKASLFYSSVQCPVSSVSSV